MNKDVPTGTKPIRHDVLHVWNGEASAVCAGLWPNSVDSAVTFEGPCASQAQVAMLGRRMAGAQASRVASKQELACPSTAANYVPCELCSKMQTKRSQSKSVCWLQAVQA